MLSKIQVNEQGIELAYIDSGPPEGRESYRTLIAIHGYGWSSAVFQKALPEAKKKGIRLIALNRRQFPESTPYSEEELAFLKQPNFDRTKSLVFMQKRSFELIGFVHHAIEKLSLPALSSDGVGNITILAWSLGNIYSFSIMGCFNDSELPVPFKKTVKECISSIILFDPPVEACGIRPTEEYHSWPEKIFAENQDPNDPGNPAKAAKAIFDWTTGWYQYDHSSLEIKREDFIESNNHPIRPPTTESAPDAQDLLASAYPPSYESENLITAGLSLGAYRVIALYVLDKAKRHRKDREEVRAPFSGVGEEDLLADKKLSWLWCENAAWPCAFSPHLHRREFGFDGSDPKRQMVALPNANHFLQWEDPERFIDSVLPLM